MSPSLWAPASRRRAPMAPVARRSRFHRHLLLWVLQTWLAMFYLAAGYAKLSQPHDLLVLMMTWPALVAPGPLRAIGVIEIGLALSVVSPLISWSLFRPILLLGAFGLAIVAGFMALFHAVNGDGFLAAVNGLLLLMALAVLVGRWSWSASSEPQSDPR